MSKKREHYLRGQISGAEGICSGAAVATIN